MKPLLIRAFSLSSLAILLCRASKLRIGLLEFLILIVPLTAAPALADAAQLLTNGGFGPPYNVVNGSNTNGSYSGNFPSGWTENSLISGVHINNIYSQEISNTVSGSAFKAVIDYASGYNTGIRFAILQQANAVAGRALTASVWMKASANCTVQIYFQEAVSPYTGRGSKSCAVTTSWQQFPFTFEPTNTEVVDMLLLYSANQPVTLWMDEASLAVQQANAVFTVAPNGSDEGGDGSLAAPYQTIAKALAQVYPGDTVQVRAGTYRETITPIQSGTSDAPITITNYNGEAVTITGADAIAGPWTLTNNGIYTADVNWDLGEGFNQVFVDGAMIHEAREPNYGSGDLLHPTTTNMTVIAIGTQSGTGAPVDSNISSATFSGKPVNFYSGGRLHAGINESWAWQRATIESSTGNTVTVNASTESTPWFVGSGMGYVYGLRSLLDSDNEWFVQHNTSPPNTLYLRIGGQANPTGHLIEIRNRTYSVNLNSKDYIVVRGLNLRCGDVQINGTGDILDRCNAAYLSHSLSTTGYMSFGGILVDGTGNTVSHCTIHDTAGCGIHLMGTDHLITRNLSYNTDYSGSYSSAILANANTSGHTITFNTAHSSGRDIMNLSGGSSNNAEFAQSRHVIEYNEFYAPGQMCRDLGCIYTYSSNAQGATGAPTRIAYNWVHDNYASFRTLIYLDNWGRNYIVDHNVCWNGVGDSAIRLNGPNDGHKVYHNTLYNCDDANTHTYTVPFSDSNNPDTTFFFSGGTYAAPDIRNDLYLSTTPDAQLTNSAIRDFRPKASAAAIDSGTLIPGYNDSYVGAAPDLGAYEAGGPYWVPGVNGWSIDQPGITSSAATGVTETSATANGTLVSSGTAPTTVNLYWNTNDGGTVPAAWAHVITLGADYTGTYQALSRTLFSLIPSTTYWYRYRSTNANGDHWSDPQNFTTAPDTPLTATWSATPTSSDWNTPANWTPATVPNGSTTTAGFATSNQTTVSISAATTVDGITFASGASGFTISSSPGLNLDLSGVGIANDSGITQNFVNNTDASTRGQIRFFGTATAGTSTVFTNNGRAVSASISGGSCNFFNNSTAGHGVFVQTGGAGSGGDGGRCFFNDTTTAGNGTFTNASGQAVNAFGGATFFSNTASAGTATFTNNGATFSGANGGFMRFADTSSADHGTFTTNGAGANGANPGVLEFRTSASADHGTFNTNGGSVAGAVRGITQFFDSSTAANGTFINNAAAVDAQGGRTFFNGSSTAGSGIFLNEGASVFNAGGGAARFDGSSTAGSASFTNDGGTVSGAGNGFLLFRDTSTAANSNSTNNGAGASGAFAGLTQFQQSATAANATITANGSAFSGPYFGGEIDFLNTSTAGNSTLIANGGSGTGAAIFFLDDSAGGTCYVEVYGNAYLELSYHNAPGLTIGSLKGTGNVFLGNLTVGSNNLSTLFSGVLQDGGGGTGGSLTKVGAGTLTLSGVNTYTGVTTVSGGELVNNGTISGDVIVDSRLSGCGTIQGSLAVNPSGIVIVAGCSLTVNGAIINNGLFILSNGAQLAGAYPSFTNNGTFDIMTAGAFSPPNGFVNNGVIIDATAVKPMTVQKTGTSLTITIDSYTGHTYQLQKATTLTGNNFSNIGAPQQGSTGTALTFTDSDATGLKGFYRVVVNP